MDVGLVERPPFTERAAPCPEALLAAVPPSEPAQHGRIDFHAASVLGRRLRIFVARSLDLVDIAHTSRPMCRPTALSPPRHGVQTPTNRVRHVGAVGLVELTVGEDYLPLHELSTNSKRTTCLPPHMVCEVHHTKSGYEQSEPR